MAAAGMIIYFDPEPLLRDGMARRLAASFPAFQILAPNFSGEVMWLGQQQSALVMVLARLEAIETGHFHQLGSLSAALPCNPVVVLTYKDDAELTKAVVGCGKWGLVPLAMAGPVVQELARLTGAGSVLVPGAPPVEVDKSGTTATQPVMSLPNGVCGPPMSVVTSKTTSSAESDQRDVVPPCLQQSFTTRQLEILACLRRGLANKMIASQLGMCESTVKIHVRNIMRKLSATNRTQVLPKIWQMLEAGQAPTSEEV